MICLIRKNNFLYVLFLFLFHQSSAQSLSFMDTLHKKCERKWSNIGEPSIGTKFVAIGIPPMHIIIEPRLITMSWKLPLVDTKLALKLRSMKFILASKEFNISSTQGHSASKGIFFLEDPHDKRFRKKILIHPKVHYIRIDVKRHIIENQIFSNKKDLTFQFIDANHTQSLANLDLQPFILLKYDSCQLDRKSKKLRRRQKHAQAYSRFLNSKILLPSLIWNKDNHVARTRSKRQTNLCKLEKFQITTEDLGHSLSKRIISPTKMVLNRCVGSCGFINSHQLEMSYHARFMMFARLKANPCCVPTSYGSRSVLLVTDEDNVAIVILNNLVATSCGCR